MRPNKNHAKDRALAEAIDKVITESGRTPDWISKQTGGDLSTISPGRSRPWSGT